MFLAACATALLCFVSASQSAPLACEELLRPLEQLDIRRLEGTWALVAVSLSDIPSRDQFKLRDSVAAHFSSNTSETATSYTFSIRLDNKCTYSLYNISLQGSSFTFDGTPQRNQSANFVHTSCQDCMLIRVDMEVGKPQHICLLSKRRSLEQEEMEEFRAQVECLAMPPPVVMDPTKELCPNERQ